jgi:hypothetical protein
MRFLMTPPVSPQIAEAQTEFAKADVRAQVLKWHQEGKPLLEMADELGIVFDGALRDAIGGLSPEEVATIRAAMVAAIAKNDTTMPVDCTLDKLPAKIAVTPEDKGGQPFVLVTEAK